MTLLLKNRFFRLSNEIAIDARDYIIENFSIDLSNYDVVIGYRADNSYFSFAESSFTTEKPIDYTQTKDAYEGNRESRVYQDSSVSPYKNPSKSTISSDLSGRDE